MLKLPKDKTSWLFYGFIMLIIVLPWLAKPGFLFFLDTVWGPVIKLDWTSYDFLLNMFAKMLSFALPVDLIEKIYISGIFLLILLGGRKIVLSIVRLAEPDSFAKNSSDGKSNTAPQHSQLLICILSLFALFNPFVYDRSLYGQFSTLVAYGCLLFVFAYLLDCYQTLNFSLLKRAGIFTGLSLMFSLHFVFFLMPFYLVFFIGLSCRWREIKERKVLVRMIVGFICLAVIIVVINSNQIIAYFSNKSPLVGFVGQGITEKDLSAFQTIGRNPMETFTNVLLMSGFWGKEQYRYFDLTDVTGWQRSFVLMLPIIFFGLWQSFGKMSRNAKIFSIGLILTFLMALILAVGIKAPIAKEISMFLYDHLPAYKGMREPQKWVAVIIPIYLYFLTIGINLFKDFKLIINNRFISGVILTAIIIMQSPLMVWGFRSQVRATEYPDDWYEVNSILTAVSPDGKCRDPILFLPWHLYMNFRWAGKVIANPAPHFFSCPVISGTNMEWGGIYDNSQNPASAVVLKWLIDKGKGGAPILDSSPRYLILAKEVDWRNYLWLEKTSYLRLIKDTKTLSLYEIQH